MVTTPEDKDTQRICEMWDVHCVTTTSFSEDGPFNKGKGINAGLAALSLSDWVVHMDADIALPATYSHHVRALKLTPSWIYGLDRVNCRSFDAWQYYRSHGLPQHEKDHLLHIGLFPPGARLVRRPFGGYVPIGYYQMWNPIASKVHAYPTEHGDAARGDVEFALNWPREKRCLIPEVVAFHLESEQAAKGANWEGRTTALFGPPRDPEPVAAPVVVPPRTFVIDDPGEVGLFECKLMLAPMVAAEKVNGSNLATHDAAIEALYPGPEALPWWRRLWNWVKAFWDWEIW